MEQFISNQELEEFKNTILIKYNRFDQPLMQVLQESQDKFGCVPIEMQNVIAEYLHISPAKINGVVSFYSMFSMEPSGKNVIGVCMGTACYVKGGERLLNRVTDALDITLGETTEDRLFTLTPTRCVGDCSNAPVVMVNEDIHRKVTSDDIPNIINQYKKSAK